ncbi:MAG: hypothetical protein F9K44_09555, partial [Hyphomicrobiaceae bacterium]
MRGHGHLILTGAGARPVSFSMQQQVSLYHFAGPALMVKFIMAGPLMPALTATDTKAMLFH